MLTSLDYYRVFYYVAKHRSFTRAAEVLTTSQPTVTRTVKNLENDLGCRLFERDRRGVVLTAEGEPVEDNGYTLRFCTYKNRAPRPL